MTTTLDRSSAFRNVSYPSCTSDDDSLIAELQKSIERAARSRSVEDSLILHMFASTVQSFATQEPPATSDAPQLADVTHALPPIAPEEISAHRGQWVILHRGRVVAHAPAADALLTDERAASAEYTLYRVPETRRRFR